MRARWRDRKPLSIARNGPDRPTAAASDYQFQADGSPSSVSVTHQAIYVPWRRQNCWHRFRVTRSAPCDVAASFPRMQFADDQKPFFTFVMMISSEGATSYDPRIAAAWSWALVRDNKIRDCRFSPRVWWRVSVAILNIQTFYRRYRARIFTVGRTIADAAGFSNPVGHRESNVFFLFCGYLGIFLSCIRNFTLKEISTRIVTELVC